MDNFASRACMTGLAAISEGSTNGLEKIAGPSMTEMLDEASAAVEEDD